MRTPSLPHLVGPRRAATRLAGAAAVAAAALLVAGCIAAPAGTPAPADSAASAAPIASPAATPRVAPVATPEPTPSAAQGRPPTPGGTHEAPTPAVATPPPPATPPSPARTPRPTRPPTPRPTAVPAALGTVTGLAHAGPTCPVAQLPPDPACADEPVPGVAIVVTDASGAVVATAVTDADGRFSIALPPGTYTLAPQPREGLMRTPGPETVVLAAGATATVDFAYDTGIR